jgi:subtilisin family serine protease
MGLIVVVGLIAGVGGIVISDDRPPVGQAPPINNTTTAEVVTKSQSESVNEPPQTYAVTAQSANAIDTQQLAEYGEVGTQADDRVELRMPPSDVTNVENISWVTDVRPVIRPEPAQTGTDIPGSSEGVGEDDSLGVQQAHQNGITGEDVEVGIIDSGFDTDNPAIASNVVETRSFRSSPGDPAHGTSVAEVVTRTAPDSQLSLVSSENGIDTEAAINYLKGQDVDIIVHSAGFPAFEDDGDHILTDEINAATGSGILFVNSAGNYAQTHWEGQFRDADRDDLHEWTQSGDERNCLPNCDRELSGDVTVYVRWTDHGGLTKAQKVIIVHHCLIQKQTSTYLLMMMGCLLQHQEQSTQYSVSIIFNHSQSI